MPNLVTQSVLGWNNAAERARWDGCRCTQSELEMQNMCSAIGGEAITKAQLIRLLLFREFPSFTGNCIENHNS